jgi:hypothetical protein
MAPFRGADPRPAGGGLLQYGFMLSKRGKTPPYEVMARLGKGAGRVGAPAQSSTPEPEVISKAPAKTVTPPPPASEEAPAEPAEGLWSQTQRPVVLRLPQGMILVLVAGLVALILLAQARVIEGTHQPGLLDGSSQQVNPIYPPEALESDPTNQPPVSEPQPGLNYYVVATYPLEDAERLVDFLAANGVEAMILPHHNKELFYVMDLKGFERGQLSGDDYRKRAELLRKLGRTWKDKERGPTNLSDLWPLKYDPDKYPQRPQ